MSKAEEFAYSKYPKSKKGLLYDLARNSIIQGYHRAEKDLELDWDDIAMLHSLLHEVEQEFKKGMYEDKTYRGYCQEILKRFKEKKAVMGHDFYYFNCPVCGCKVSANWIIK